MPINHFDDTTYNLLLKARANAVAAYTLLTSKVEGAEIVPPSAGDAVIAINLLISVENITLAIEKLTLNKDEQEQESVEISALKQFNFLKDARFR